VHQTKQAAVRTRSEYAKPEDYVERAQDHKKHAKPEECWHLQTLLSTQASKDERANEYGDVDNDKDALTRFHHVGNTAASRTNSNPPQSSCPLPAH